MLIILLCTINIKGTITTEIRFPIQACFGGVCMKAIQLALAMAWYYWIINCVSESRRLT